MPVINIKIGDDGYPESRKKSPFVVRPSGPFKKVVRASDRFDSENIGEGPDPLKDKRYKGPRIKVC